MRKFILHLESSDGENFEDTLTMEDGATDSKINHEADEVVITNWWGEPVDLVGISEIKGNDLITIELK